MTENYCKICQKPANQQCSACHSVFYCSRKHQKNDWKVHKKTCQKFEVAVDDVMGRYLKAATDLDNNEVVLREKPLVFGPVQETLPVCLGCNQELAREHFKPCPKCHLPMCSDQCINNPCHQPECHFLVQSGEEIFITNFEEISPFYQTIIVLRCLYQKHHDPKLWKKLIQLQSHCEERKTTDRYRKEEHMAKEWIQKMLKLEFSVEEILTVYGIVMVNAHEVPLAEPPYIAIYEKTSMLENDCSSNCSKSFTEKGELIITTGTKIKKGDHLSIAYSDPLWATPARRTFLYDSKYFWCRCKRCSDSTEFGTYFSSVHCQNGTCNGFLLPKTFLEPDSESWCCNKCSYSVTSDLVSSLWEKVNRELENLDKNNVNSCKVFLQKLRKILPSNNSLIVDAKLALSQLIGTECVGARNGLAGISNEDLELKRSLCVELITLTKTLIPSEKRVRGLIVFELHAALAELARRRSNNFEDMEKCDLLLKESRAYVKECIQLLKFEPEILPEGKICKQAIRNFEDINNMLCQ